MSLKVVSVSKNKYLKDFLRVPFLLHQHDTNWVPPLDIMMKRLLHPKNPFFKHAEICMWVAYRDNKPVGRIAGIINHAHNQFHQENIAFWGFFESENVTETTKVLLEQVEQWATSRNVTKIRGPMSPSINYDSGLQISAFDTQPFIMMTQNPAYYQALIEQQEYKKVKDLQAWKVDADKAAIDPRKYQMIKKLKAQHQVTIRSINMKDFKNELRIILNIFNHAWKDNWGFVPIEFDEFEYLTADLESIVIDKFVYFAEIDGKPVGFAVGLPDINQILIRIRNGKLLPFNFLKLFWYSKIKKVIDQGRILMLGVLQEYQHLPIGGMLYCEYFDHAIKAGYTCGEFSWILEDNVAMQSGLKFINAHHYKTYRVYDKVLKND